MNNFLNLSYVHRSQNKMKSLLLSLFDQLILHCSDSECFSGESTTEF